MPPDRRPDLLYHYCDLDSFVAIVRNRAIRLSGTMAYNDPSEGEFFDAAIRQAIQESDKSPELRQSLWESYAARREHAIAFCLSEEADNLGQWRAYGDDGRGVAIGFRLGGGNIARRDLSWRPNWKPVSKWLCLLKMVYTDRQKMAETARKLLRSKLRSTDPADLKGHERALVSALAFRRLGYKHAAYADENEWRLAFPLPDPAQPRTEWSPRLEFLPRGNRLVPYHDAALADFGIEIARVQLGPRHKSAADDIRAFLVGQGLPEAAVTASDIPYRGRLARGISLP